MSELDKDALVVIDQQEEEITELKKKVSEEEGRTAKCQSEIARLRAIIRYYNRTVEVNSNPDYKKLFEALSRLYCDRLHLCTEEEFYP